MKRDEDWAKGVAKIEIFINGEWVELHSFITANKIDDMESSEIENLINDLDFNFDDSGPFGIDITWK